MSEEDAALKKKLAEAQAEIADLKLRLSNSTMLLKIEMTASGKLPKFDEEMRHRRSGKTPRSCPE